MNLYLILILNAVLMTSVLGVFIWNKRKQRKLENLIEDGEVLLGADIDAVREKPFAFKLAGMIHVIKPMNVVQFVEVTEALAHLDSLKSKKCSKEELLAAYDNLFGRVCGSVTREMLENMNSSQVAALLNTIIEFIMGKAHLEAEKKRPNLGQEVMGHA